MNKNKEFAFYGLSMIEINDYKFEYANGYSIVKNKDELILRIDCEISNERQYKFLMKSLNDILCNSDEFDIYRQFLPRLVRHATLRWQHDF